MATRLLWPNLFLLGVPKAGTTTVFEILGTSDAVHTPHIKESGFFASDEQWARGLGYAQRTFDFATDRPYSLESTPWNFYLDSALDRIVSVCDSTPTTAVIILRDPIDRAISMFYDQQGVGAEQRTIDEAFVADLEADWEWEATNLDTTLRHSYLRGGRYVRRLEAIDGRFDQVIVLLFEDLIRNQALVAADLGQRLGGLRVKTVGAANPQTREIIPVTRTATWIAEKAPPRIRRTLGRHVVSRSRRAIHGIALSVMREVSHHSRTMPSERLVRAAQERLAAELPPIEERLGRAPPWRR